MTRRRTILPLPYHERRRERLSERMNAPNHIRVWRFDDAPEELRDLSHHGGDEDWLALIPPAFAYLFAAMAGCASCYSSKSILSLWRKANGLARFRCRGRQSDD